MSDVTDDSFQNSFMDADICQHQWGLVFLWDRHLKC